MLSITGKYISVFNVVDKGRYVQAKLVSSKKNKDGSYQNMSWFARFVGNSLAAAKELNDKDKIEIVNGIIENNIDDNKRVWHTIVVFNFNKQ